MEDKSIDTLRLTVQRLLNDFENEGKHNVVKDFEARKGETKHQALRRMMHMLNMREEEFPEQAGHELQR